MTPLELANLCWDAYSTADLEEIAPFDTDGVQGFVARRDNLSLLVFRGSDELADWLVNLDATAEHFPTFGGRCHAGFGYSALGIHAVVQSALDYLAPTGDPLWITGHSLGAALAVLFGQLLSKYRPLVVTFGAPRVLCRDAAAVYRPESWRYIHGYDMVPRIPTPLRGFVHVGTAVGFGAGAWGRHFWTSPLDALRDHKISKYVSGLTADPLGSKPLCV